MSEDFIPVEQTLMGAFASLDYAQTFYDQSNELYEQKKFQASIPIATISMEESLKGTEFTINFRHSEPMTREGWEKLKNHKHKLTHVKDFAIRVMEDATTEEEEKTKEELRKSGMIVPDISGKDLAKLVKKRNFLHSHFQTLRELCFYSNWNDVEQSWNVFSDLSDEKQQSLAFFVLKEAEHSLDFLKLSIEKIVNNLRANGTFVDTPLPYPPYLEVRSMQDFEYIKKLNVPISKHEHILHDNGIAVLQKIVGLKSLESVDFGLLSDVMGKYLKIIQKQSDDGQYLHPLIKSIMMSLFSSKDTADGNFGAFSTDADPGKEKFSMAFFVGVETKDGHHIIKEIKDLQNKDYKYPMSKVEQILKTELIIERHEGSEVPISAYIEALSVIGIKAKMIKKEELPEAFEYAKNAIKNNHLPNTPQAWIDEINNMNGLEDWDNISTFARITITNPYAIAKYSEFGYNMFITPSLGIEKWKARTSVIHAIQESFLPTS